MQLMHKGRSKSSVCFLLLSNMDICNDMKSLVILVNIEISQAGCYTLTMGQSIDLPAFMAAVLLRGGESCIKRLFYKEDST